MLDYLTIHSSTENPTFITILFTLCLSFLLSSLIAFTYEKTTRQVFAPTDYLQTLVLVGMIAAIVMQAIGDSVARGLGMLGALAIIRFRTTLRVPRNMVFVFASLAVGIACGVYGYVIAVTGTIGFCTTAFILKYSPMNPANKMIGTLKFEFPLHSPITIVETILDKHCQKYSCIRHKTIIPKSAKKRAPMVINGESDTPVFESPPDLSVEKFRAYEYKLKLKNQEEANLLEQELLALEEMLEVKMDFEELVENV